MLKTIEATIDQSGHISLLEAINLPEAKRALVTILDEPAPTDMLTAKISETALLSEASLAEDWNRPEEDEAWQHLQPGR